MKRALFMILLIASWLLPANAVLKEKNLDSTLHVLRVELTNYHSQLELQTGFMKEQQNRVRTQMMAIMENSNQNALMLYSQKDGNIFDLTYACHQATEQYLNYQKNVAPFRSYLDQISTSLTRYDSLINSLRTMPTMMLSEEAQIDRNVCLTYAINIRRTLKGAADQLNEYISLYKMTDSRLKTMNDYANNCYQNIQTSIFRNGGDNYFKIIKQFQRNLMITEVNVMDKYKPLKDIRSQWDSKYLFYLFALIFFYGFISVIINIFSIKVFVSKAKRFKNKEFRTKRTCIIMATSVVTFAIILGLIQVIFRNQNFLLMASGLLVEYAWLLGVVLISLLIRLNGKQIMRGFRIYSPIILIGFLVIAFRVILIPNSLVNLIFPPILIACTIWQWDVIRRIRKPENARHELLNEANMKMFELSNKIAELKNNDDDDENNEDTEKEDNIKSLQSELDIITTQQKKIQNELNIFRLPKSDYNYAAISLLVFVSSLFCAWIGYTLLSVQIIIWWVMQLTCILTITCLIGIMAKRADRKKQEIKKSQEEYNRTHKDNMHISEEQMLLDHWFSRMLRHLILPVIGVFSVALSIYWATDVFNLSDIARMMFNQHFVDTSYFRLSLVSIMMGFVNFFIFRFICDILKALWKRHLEIKNMGDQKTIDSRNVMGKNIIQTMVWGLWFILILTIFHISSTWIVIISGGLYTGVGFASKNILENIFYGISLMTGRVKIGDIIQIDNVRGKVNSISYTSTTLETTDGSIMAFENAQLFDKNYKNSTRNHGLELDILEVGVAYGTNIELTKKILIDAISKVPGVETKTKKINIILKSFNDSSIVLKILVWVDVIKQTYIDGNVLETVYNSLNENGIEMPFPQLDVHMKHAGDESKNTII